MITNLVLQICFYLYGTRRRVAFVVNDLLTYPLFLKIERLQVHARRVKYQKSGLKCHGFSDSFVDFSLMTSFEGERVYSRQLQGPTVY